MYPVSPASLMRCPCSRPRKQVEVTPSEMKSSCFLGCCLSSHCIKQILHVNSDLQTKSNNVCSCTCDLITTSGWTMREDHLKAAFYTSEEVLSSISTLLHLELKNVLLRGMPDVSCSLHYYEVLRSTKPGYDSGKPSRLPLTRIVESKHQSFCRLYVHRCSQTFVLREGWVLLQG